MDLPVWNPETPDWEFAVATFQAPPSTLSVMASRPRLGVLWSSMLAEIDTSFFDEAIQFKIPRRLSLRRRSAVSSGSLCRF